ncbi:MAG: sulfotransferase [Flavobacteriales bacterium]|nr:sulfotransferase [Flavobacteriales bacterium]NCA20784.1 sulfotransferase [Crocinitomicaceae bacterium]
MRLEEIKVNYILGLGRSGTTLLLKELGKSQHVVSNPESLFILDFLYVYEPEKVLSPSEVSFFLKQIFKLKTGRFVHLDLWKIDREKLNKAIEEQSPIQFKNLIKLVNLNSEIGLSTSNPEVIIDKNPPYTVHFEQLLKLDLNSKFIGIYRHYWDNIISRNKFKLDAINHPYYHALMWCLYNESMFKSEKKHPENLLLIRYEDLVNHPEEYLNCARKFMHLSNELKGVEDKTLVENLLQNLKNNEEKKDFLEMHGKVFKEIDTQAIGKKNTKFTENQINNIHYICSKTASKLGYESVNFKQPNLYQRLYISWFKSILLIVEYKHHSYFRASHAKRNLFRTIAKPWTIFLNKF